MLLPSSELNVIHATDHCAMGVLVLVLYELGMQLTRLSTCARLEPAGSHGVWGLDDYQFMPFIWGSSQLNGHTTITPSSIHSQSILDTNAADYLYLSCIKFVKQVVQNILVHATNSTRGVCMLRLNLWG